MTYDECVAALQTMLEIPLNQSDDNFTRILPAMFNHAEGRIFGDLQFLWTNVTQQAQLTALTREFALPASVRILEQISVLSPASAITSQSKRTVLERVSPVAIDLFWPQASFRPGMPQKYALLGSTPLPIASDVTQPQSFGYVVRLMPAPDKAYPIELTGTIHPSPISPTNPETFISLNFAELFLAACMIYGSGYQRDFGAQADDPQRAMSWEGQYRALLQGVLVENARMRGEGPSFTSLPAAQMAQQPRSP